MKNWSEASSGQEGAGGCLTPAGRSSQAHCAPFTHYGHNYRHLHKLNTTTGSRHENTALHSQPLWLQPRLPTQELPKPVPINPSSSWLGKDDTRGHASSSARVAYLLGDGVWRHVPPPQRVGVPLAAHSHLLLPVVQDAALLRRGLLRKR